MLKLIAVYFLFVAALVLAGYRYETEKRRAKAKQEADDRWHARQRQIAEEVRPYASKRWGAAEAEALAQVPDYGAQADATTVEQDSIDLHRLRERTFTIGGRIMVATRPTDGKDRASAG